MNGCNGTPVDGSRLEDFVQLRKIVQARKRRLLAESGVLSHG